MVRGMGQEIEYRYLLTEIPDPGAAPVRHIAQGYLSADPDRTVRVRVMEEQGFLTVKGRRTGPAAPEFEYEIPVQDARALLDLCGDLVLAKDRYALPGPDGLVWDIDVFTGRHSGLVIAEIELPAIDSPFILPGWLGGEEITGRAEFSNAALAGMTGAALERLLRR